MAITSYAYGVGADITGQAVEPAQLNNELVTAGYTPHKITFDHSDSIVVYIDDATAKTLVDPTVLAHVPA